MKTFLIILFMLQAVTDVLLIGQERQVITPAVAATGMLFNALMIWGIIRYL